MALGANNKVPAAREFLQQSRHWVTGLNHDDFTGRDDLPFAAEECLKCAGYLTSGHKRAIMKSHGGAQRELPALIIVVMAPGDRQLRLRTTKVIHRNEPVKDKSRKLLRRCCGTAPGDPLAGVARRDALERQ